MPIVRKTVVIHEPIDTCVKKVFTILIQSGKKNVSYSLATNFLLLAAMLEATKPEGFNEKTLELIWKFVDDRGTLDKLNLEDLLTTLEEKLKEKKKKVSR